ncbi:MAG: ABC transporter ATP-binding protein [Eubacteriales bacterium]|nr:ABC transporter ATP-binding protein [Eubacteriales bacterium]
MDNKDKKRKNATTLAQAADGTRSVRKAHENVEISDETVVIEFKHITKTYKLFKDDRQRLKAVFNKRIQCKTSNAINNFSAKIHRGEAVALFGRNGAGKSTLLKMVTGVTYPTVGKVEVKGRVSALLELTAGFDPEFTGRENIYFRGQLMGMKPEEVKKLEPVVEAFAELGDYMDQPVRTYSSGMKARLGFAINVNIDPEILIVDEALSVGDVSFRKKCLKKVKELIANNEVTFLFVTHSTKVAQEFCTRGIVMRKGSIRFDGDIDQAVDFYNKMVEEEDIMRRRKKSRERLF